MRARLFALALGAFLLVAFIPYVAGAQPQSPTRESHEDALTPPPPPPTLASGGAQGPSQYMAGHVAVRVVLPESTGSSENWSQAQIDEIHTQIQSALNWWAEQLPLAHLSFTVRLQVVPSAYEPITYGLEDEGLWIGDVLTRLGFTDSSYFDQAYAADFALRDELGTDWATTIFVANSASTSDSTFTDGHFAYAYINGPFMVLTSDVGGYGTSQMKTVVAHEFAHLFGALDQYDTARVSCSQSSGYLNVPTTNSQYNSCGTHLPSIMIETITSFRNGSIDPSARAQIGYRDSDNDDIIDPLDTTPELVLDPILTSIPGTRPHISGQSTDTGFPAPLQSSISINHISAIEYRINGGAWIPISASDGAFDSSEEHFATTLPLYDGNYVVEVRARNSVGQVSTIGSGQLLVSQVGSQPDYTPHVPLFTSVNTVYVQLNAPATTQAVQLSVDPSFSMATWQPYGAEVPFSLAPHDGVQTIYVRYRDAAGLDSLPIPLSVTLDTTPPDGSASRDPQSLDWLHLYAKDGGSGVAEVGLQMSDSEPVWLPFRGLIDLSILRAQNPNVTQEQEDELQVLFRDTVGNTSDPHPVSTVFVIHIPLVIH